MTINRLSGLLLLAMLVFGQCSSDYDKGEQEFKVENYDEAKSHYKLVEKESDNYDKAQSRILEIDSIIEELLFDKAKILFSEKMYSDAEVLFFTIDSASTLYVDSKTFLTKIDSVRKARQLESKRLEKARKTEEERIAKSKEIEDEKALRQVKQKVRVLYNSLMAFKDKNDFHYYGFGVGYKYNKWLKDVQDLKNTPEANLLLGHGFVVGDLEMLGLEYMGSKGQETEYSRWSRKTISDGLRK